MHIKKENAAYKYPTNNLLREEESGKEKKHMYAAIICFARGCSHYTSKMLTTKHLCVLRHFYGYLQTHFNNI